MTDYLVSVDVYSTSHDLKELTLALGAEPGSGSHSRGEPRPGSRTWNVSLWRLTADHEGAPSLAEALEALAARCREIGLLTPGRLPDGATGLLNIGVLADAFTCSVELEPELLLPYLEAGFRLEVSVYPSDDDEGARSRPG